LTFSGSTPSLRVDTTPTAANASLISMRSRSAGSMPSLRQAFGDRVGRLLVQAGVVRPATMPVGADLGEPGQAQLLGLGLAHHDHGAAPSEICEAEPAVMVPSAGTPGAACQASAVVSPGGCPRRRRHARVALALRI
jgi:hypothetical protein